MEALADLLWQTNRHIRHVVAGDAFPPLPHSHRFVLFLLKKEFGPGPVPFKGPGGPKRISVLAKELHLTSAAVTQIVTDLELGGLVRRNRDENDRRAVLVSLTDEGERLLQEMRGRRRSLAAQFLGVLVQEDRDHLARILKSLLTRVKDSDLDRRGS